MTTPDRRTHLAETALAVVAERGLKGITHRAVDAAAGVAPGTTSNYFRTRASLVGAVIDLLGRRDTALLRADERAGVPTSIDQVADRVAGVLVALSGEHADLTRVRLAISLDQPEKVSGTHHGMVAGLTAWLQGLGVDDAPSRARAVADYADGLLLHAVTARRGEPVDPADARATVLRLLSSP